MTGDEQVRPCTARCSTRPARCRSCLPRSPPRAECRLRPGARCSGSRCTGRIQPVVATPSIQGVAMGTAKHGRCRRGIRPALGSIGRPTVGKQEDRQRFWKAIAEGLTSEKAGILAGVSPVVGARWFRQAGGMPNVSFAPISAWGAIPVLCGARGDRAPSCPRSRCLCDRQADRQTPFNDLARARAQRGHSQRVCRIQSNDGTVACPTTRQASEGSEAGKQRGVEAVRA